MQRPSLWSFPSPSPSFPFSVPYLLFPFSVPFLPYPSPSTVPFFPFPLLLPSFPFPSPFPSFPSLSLSIPLRPFFTPSLPRLPCASSVFYARFLRVFLTSESYLAMCRLAAAAAARSSQRPDRCGPPRCRRMLPHQPPRGPRMLRPRRRGRARGRDPPRRLPPPPLRRQRDPPCLHEFSAIALRARVCQWQRQRQCARTFFRVAVTAFGRRAKAINQVHRASVWVLRVQLGGILLERDFDHDIEALCRRAAATKGQSADGQMETRGQSPANNNGRLPR